MPVEIDLSAVIESFEFSLRGLQTRTDLNICQIKTNAELTDFYNRSMCSLN